MNQPTFSVVMPCLNRITLIEEAIQSVLDQGYPSVEFIFMDGGSTDGTVELLCGFEQNDSRFRVFSEPDTGVYDAVNKGIRRAKGDLVVWLNSDDILEEGALHTAAKAWENHPEAELFCGEAIIFAGIGGQGAVMDRVMPFMGVAKARMGFHNITPRGVSLNACFLKRSIYERVGAYDASYKLAADKDFLIRLAIDGPVSVNLGCPTYRYRYHDGSLTLNASEVQAVRRLEENVRLCRKWLTTKGLSTEARNYCGRHFAQASLSLALYRRRNGAYTEAIQYMRSAFVVSPRETVASVFRALATKISVLARPVGTRRRGVQ